MVYCRDSETALCTWQRTSFTALSSTLSVRRLLQIQLPAHALVNRRPGSRICKARCRFSNGALARVSLTETNGPQLEQRTVPVFSTGKAWVASSQLRRSPACIHHPQRCASGKPYMEGSHLECYLGRYGRSCRRQSEQRFCRQQRLPTPQDHQQFGHVDRCRTVHHRQIGFRNLPVASRWPNRRIRQERCVGALPVRSCRGHWYGRHQ